MVDILNDILVNVLGAVICHGHFQYVCGIHIVGYEMKWSSFYVPPCSAFKV